MGEFIYAEHPEGCSLRLFYRTSPCKERGSARSAKTTNPVRNVALPVPVGSNRFTIIFCCMGDFINTEHPEGCSLRFYVYNISINKTKPKTLVNYPPPRLRYAPSRSPSYPLKWTRRQGFAHFRFLARLRTF